MFECCYFQNAVWNGYLIKLASIVCIWYFEMRFVEVPLVIWAFENWNFPSFCLHIWESCISRMTWVNTDGPCEYNISWQYTSTNPSFCLFVLLRIRVSSFRELLWQMLQERRALSCWAARDLDSPQVPAADFTASQLCSQSATRASLREALVCVEC